jgi:amino acid adenylation domain-containing protein
MNGSSVGINRAPARSLLTKENVKDIYPLSSMQEGILFHSLIDQGPTYFQQQSFRLMGSLDLDGVRRALNEVVVRHDALRTLFKYTGVDIPLQIVMREWEADFIYRDLRPLADQREREAALAGHKKGDRARLFDLSKGPLMRLALFQLSDDECELIWSWHHIVMDGWCLGIIQEEFIEIYDSYREQRSCRLDPPVPFSAYIKWVQTLDKQKARDFWREYLADFSEITGLASSRPSLGPSGYLNSKLCFVLDEVKTDRLRKLANTFQVTLVQLLHCVWGILLGKYTRSGDVVFGSVVSTRPSVVDGVEKIVGLLINTTPVRIRFEAETRFGEVLASAKHAALASAEYNWFPLNELQTLSEIEGALFDHILVFHEQHKSHQVTAGERARVLKTDNFEQTNFDLYADVTVGINIRFDFTFNGHVYDEPFVRRMGRVIEVIVDQVLAAPGIPMRSISLFTEEDRLLLDGFNATDFEFPEHNSVVEVIERICAERSTDPAIVCEGRILTYGELNERANRLARYLADQVQLSPDDLVGILMERTERMVASIMAVWKAGAAYVPIDVSYPLNHINSMISDSGAKLVVTESPSAGAALLAGLSSAARVIVLDEEEALIAGYDASNPSKSIAPGDLAYVIYTSGSTGKPKGAMVEHAGMLNHLYAKIRDLDMGPGSVVAQNASHCFDISVWQFIAPLMLGGRTAIYSKNLVLQPELLLHRMAEDGVTILEVVPSYLSTLLDTEEESLKFGFQSLGYVVVTGEALSLALVRRWFTHFPGLPLVNAYGATETSDDVTHHVMTEAPAEGLVPLGRTLPNWKIYVADEFMNLCPVGIKGEILVSGVGVGRGYLHDRARTDEVFVEDPFALNKGVRLYKTGDLGSYREDGLLDCFGRKDNQVKVNGFRVELEEIEHRLRLHPPVQDAAVVYKKNSGGQAHLTACLVAGGEFDIEALRDFLSRELPDHMIPAHFAMLPAMPLTENGKLDRKALRELASSTQYEYEKAAYVAPRNETEERLVNVWQEVLKVERVGIFDNFFAIGGDSFKAIRVAAKFGKSLRVPDLYEYSTIEKLAAFLLQKNQDGISFLYELTPAVENAKHVIISIPNSAGDPLIYRETAAALMQLTSEYSLYSVSLPRQEPGPEETMTTVMEAFVVDLIQEIKKKTKVPITLLGQCNGAGLALRLAFSLAEEQLPCKAIIMSAQLPRTKPGEAEDRRTDTEIFQLLDKLGGTYPATLEDQIMFTRNFRYDGVMATTCYNYCIERLKDNTFNRLNAPLYCVVGDNDALTRNYRNGFKRWEYFAEFVELITIRDVGHYVWREKPAELARVIFEVGEDQIEKADSAASTSFSSRLKKLLLTTR